MSDPATRLFALILEDSADDARIEALTLETQGLPVEWRRVETEDELRTALEARMPDVVLADHGMPRLDSMTALARVRALPEPPPFIIVSGTIGEEMAVDALRAGASDYVSKNHLERLGPAVERARSELRVRAERHLAEERLRASEARYRALFEDAPDGILLMDHDRVVDSNARAPEILGRDRERLVGLTVDRFSPRHQPDGHESAARARAITGEALQGTTQSFEWQIVRGDDTPAMVEVVLGRVDWTGGTNLHAIVRDVTERHAMQAEMRKLSSAMHQVADAIIITDADQSIEYVNPAFERVTGYTASEVIGRSPALLRSSHTDPEVRQRLADAVRRGKGFHGMIVNRRRSGELYYTDMSVTPIHDERGRVTHFVGSQYDLTDRLRTERELAHRIHYDPVTDLPNRALVLQHLEHMLAQRRRHDERIIVMHIDLDGFGLLNETLGRSGGDGVLQTLGRRLVDFAGTDATVGRVGNDGFVIAASLTGREGHAERWVRGAQQALEPPITHDNETIAMTGTVGVALAPADGDEADRLLHCAEMAMHRARQGGREQIAFYAPAMHEEARRWLSVESGLRRALEQREFHLEYQPQVDLHTSRMSGLEALLRWDDPQRGPVAPGEFIPLLEKSELIVPVGEWVLHEACRRIREWQDELAAGEEMRVAVNLSLVQFARLDLVETVGRALADTGAAARFLQLELTETSLARDPEAATRTLHALREIGISIALDDFGTGYSALNYLKQFPIDVVKIDRVFVDGVTDNPGDAAILRAVLELARSRGMKTVAEGVETPEQARFLRAEGCRYVQGFHFARPSGAENIRALLDSRESFPIDEEAECDRPGVLVCAAAPDLVDRIAAELAMDGYRTVSAADTVEALQWLATNPQIGVVLTEDTEGIDASELLQKAREMHPTVRRALITPAPDIDTIRRVVNSGAVNCLLSAPIDGTELRRTIASALGEFEARRTRGERATVAGS